MANHVYYSIDIDSTEEGHKAFEDTLVTTTRTQLNWEDKEIQVKELAPIHDLAFMPKVERDEDGEPMEAYSWYIDNVGAKWCNIEDWDSVTISGYSAWSAPIDFAEHIVKYIGKIDPNVTLSMTFEDEFRNFIGVANMSYCDGEVYVDIEESDIDELCEQMREHIGVTEEEQDADDFEMWEEYKDTGLVPGEYIDDLVYEFFSQNRR